jgi:hypothetical protein
MIYSIDGGQGICVAAQREPTRIGIVNRVEVDANASWVGNASRLTRRKVVHCALLYASQDVCVIVCRPR